MKFFVIIISFFLILSCQTDTATDSGDTGMQADALPAEDLLEKNGIRLIPFTESAEISGASLELASPLPGQKLIPGKNTFRFIVDGFIPGMQTTPKPITSLANSEHGQHIHVLIDNDPYTAHYVDSAERDLTEGVHTLLAFLSRSWHESVKTRDAFVLLPFRVGSPADSAMPSLNGPLLFYSRPKGSYTGADTENLLLDFYTINTTIGQQHKVEATIDGTVFVLNEWKPYLVQGLGPGSHTFRLRLLDKENRLVPGPFSDSGDRTITLQP